MKFCSGGGTSGAGSGPGADGAPARGGRPIYGLGADAGGFDPVTDSFSTQTSANLKAQAATASLG
ncbi:hypothetical protein [Actinomadura sediminis]|uniref:Uncharacterized protein n=1 Tax=Actinomadura sediminis TaxID=1038904 RepID=A0ABW3EUC4_9ACTN